ncbi:MAG: hypothetical protein ACE5IR_15245 [bacterium]
MFSLRNLRIGLASIALMLLFLTSSGLDAQYRLRSGVVSAAGDTSSSAGVRMLASGGQPHPVAPSSSFTRVLIPGFIPGLIPPVQQNTATISGTIRDTQQVAIGGVTVNFSNADTSISTTTNSSGFYSLAVPLQVSGKVEPSLDEYSFRPLFLSYTSISADIANQDYTGTFTSGQPAIPIELDVINVFADSALMTWTDNSSIEDGFIIERTSHTDTTVFQRVKVLPPNTEEFPLDGLQPRTIYYARIASFVDSIGGLNSKNFSRQRRSAFAQNRQMSEYVVKRFVTATSGGAHPTHLVASTRSNTAILLTWKDNSDDAAEETQIERREPSVATWTELLPVTGLLPANTR